MYREIFSGLMHFHFFLPMNLDYIVLFHFACLLVFNRTKAAGMWHKCSNLGGVPASRVGSVSRTQTWNRFSTSVNEILDNSLFLWSSLGKTDCIFGMCFPLDTWTFDPEGKKDLLFLSLWITSYISSWCSEVVNSS